MNSTQIAARVGVAESRTTEITSFLRPNPDLTGTLDQINPFTEQPPPSGTGGNSYDPLAYALPSGSISYLHERELRSNGARQATAVASDQLGDQERNLLFTLRSAFVQILQQKATLALAQENLSYYDQVLSVSRAQRQLSDIARADLDRLELQRVQYETDLQTASVNLRTAKIQLLMLLNDRSPVERFDITQPYEFLEQGSTLEEFRRTALDARPDLKAALQSIEQAKTQHQLAIDISRNQHLRDATEAQVFNDVDSVYATIETNLILLKTYKTNYLERAVRVRDTILFSYQHGGASLLDFSQAQQDYRSDRLNYVNLIGSYLTTAAEMNLVVGREVIQ